VSVHIWISGGFQPKKGDEILTRGNEVASEHKFSLSFTQKTACLLQRRKRRRSKNTPLPPPSWEMSFSQRKLIISVSRGPVGCITNAGVGGEVLDMFRLKREKTRHFLSGNLRSCHVRRVTTGAYIDRKKSGKKKPLLSCPRKHWEERKELAQAMLRDSIKTPVGGETKNSPKLDPRQLFAFLMGGKHPVASVPNIRDVKTVQ